VDWKTARDWVPIVVFALATGAILNVTFSIAPIYVAIGFSGWAFIGHLVTFDDDLPGGWSNPDGRQAVPFRELLAKGLLFLTVCLAALFPSVRSWGT
jgi:hypothetical protein